MTYAHQQLVDEVAYVAYYFHWPLETILALEHPRRRTFIQAIGDINRAINGEGSADGGMSADATATLLAVS